VILLLLGVALAEGPPARPEPVAPIPNECSRALGIDFGKPFPAGLVVDGKGACAAVAFPASYAADLLNTQSWAEAQEQWWPIEAARTDYELKLKDSQLEACTTNLEDARRLPPVWQRPVVVFSGGFLVGAGAVIGGAYALGQIAQ
jgi:hypothetical protein